MSGGIWLVTAKYASRLIGRDGKIWKDSHGNPGAKCRTTSPGLTCVGDHNRDTERIGEELTPQAADCAPPPVSRASEIGNLDFKAST